MPDKRIGLCVGFYRPGTGLSRVLETITAHLANDIEFHLIGVGYKGEPIKGLVTIYPCNLWGGDIYGVHQLQEKIDELQPDFVFVLNDLWVLPLYQAAHSESKGRVPFFAYAALDGKIVDPKTVDGLGFYSCIVAYTEFARSEIESALRRNPQYQEDGGPSLIVIPHGVDTDVFYPREDVRELKRRWFPSIKDSDSAFIVLNANRPHGRKRIDLSIEAFSYFVNSTGANAYLMLHNSLISLEQREEIVLCAADNGVPDRVLITPEGAPFYDDDKLNELYNVCDVGINTSMGEGWGMVSMEHAAAGKPQIVPAHSACEEIWSKSAYLIDVESRYVPPFSVLELAEISVQSAAKQLENSYQNWGSGFKPSVSTRLARNPKFNWKSIADEWKPLF